MTKWLNEILAKMLLQRSQLHVQAKGRIDIAMNRIYAKHLSGMVKIPTVSHADPTKTDFTVFDAFHDYLARTYPLIHRILEKKVLGRATLLFRWKAIKPSKPPVLLMAHQDVVPAGDASRWKYPPFSGEIAEGYVWGRGSIDCKSVLLAEMEAVETLIAASFKPDFDIYLAFNANEEVQAQENGAQLVVEYLRLKGVKLGCVFDEGGAFVSGSSLGFEGYIGNVAIGEKASQDYEIYQESDGGHSMAPGQGTALGAVAKAAATIEANPLPYRLTTTVRQQLKALASLMEGKRSEIYRHPDEHLRELGELAQKDKWLDSLLHTTFALTMAYASAQSNILPERAGIIMNCRALEGDTADGLLKYFRSLIAPEVSIKLVAGKNPLPSTSTAGRPYSLISATARAIYGANIIIVPGLLAGGTDAKHYTAICDNVFRFTGFIKDDRWGCSHQIDERIPCDALESSIKFYLEYLNRY